MRWQRKISMQHPRHQGNWQPWKTPVMLSSPASQLTTSKGIPLLKRSPLQWLALLSTNYLLAKFQCEVEPGSNESTYPSVILLKKILCNLVMFLMSHVLLINGKLINNKKRNSVVCVFACVLTRAEVDTLCFKGPRATH